MKNKLLILAFLLLAYLSHAQQSPFQDKFHSVDLYIDSLMNAWNIPGLALGIVYKDKLIYAKGYGYRDLENKLPVLPTTIFPIASNTKLFTAMAAAIFAVEGRLDLDKPARNYLPSLRFSNDELNAKVTMRDMLSHRTGLQRYDGIWVASPLSRKELIDKMVYMKPQLGFREGYNYNNMAYAASGAVLESISGMSWEEIIRLKFFQPLEMHASHFAHDEMTKAENFAHAYFEPDSTRRLKKVTFSIIGPGISPAGSINSNIEDMSHWMIALLNEGRYKGQQVIPEAAIMQTLIPNTIADKEGKWPELSHALYGLARSVQTYKGYKISTHTGSADGYYSNLTFIPSENIAVYIVHNGPAGIIRPIMAWPVIDRLLGLSYTPWSDRYMAIYLKNKADYETKKESVNASKIRNTSPSHPLLSYLGKYYSPLYDEIEIILQDDHLVLQFRKQESVLHHFHYDQFFTDEEKNGEPDYRLNFFTNSSGAIDRFTMEIGGDQAEFIKSKK